MPKKQTFETQLETLEALVTKMEAGGLSLDETLACYEQGAKLAKGLNARLDEAQQRLSELKDGALLPLEDA